MHVCVYHFKTEDLATTAAGKKVLKRGHFPTLMRETDLLPTVGVKSYHVLIKEEF